MKRILCCVTEWGYWGEELVAPVEILEKNGYKIDYVSPTGKKPTALSVSMDPTYKDPALKKEVTSKDFAEKTRAFENSNVFDNIKSLSEWFPEMPYFNSKKFGQRLEEYYNQRLQCWQDLDVYDALLIPGGSGSMVDIANNQRVHDLILGFYNKNKLIVAECYSVTALAFARDWTERESIIKGKHITGHALEYDYKDGTGFSCTGNLNFGPPFYPLEFILRDAVGENGKYHGGVGYTTSTILDYPFLTGRSTQDSTLVGELMVEVIENGLKKYGWN